MVIIDAKTMAPKPVAVVSLPARVPAGFHTIFVSEVSCCIIGFKFAFLALKSTRLLSLKIHILMKHSCQHRKGLAKCKVVMPGMYHGMCHLVGRKAIPSCGSYFHLILPK